MDRCQAMSQCVPTIVEVTARTAHQTYHGIADSWGLVVIWRSGLDTSLSHDDGSPLEFHFDDAHGVLVKDLALDLQIRGQAPDRGEDLRSEAFVALSQRVGAIAAEHQLVLMTLEKFARLILVAKHRIQP